MLEGLSRSKTRQFLKAEGEEILIWYCNILQRTGFPLSVKDVIALAEKILRKRDPIATISPLMGRSQPF